MSHPVPRSFSASPGPQPGLQLRGVPGKLSPHSPPLASQLRILQLVGRTRAPHDSFVPRQRRGLVSPKASITRVGTFAASRAHHASSPSAAACCSAADRVGSSASTSSPKGAAPLATAWDQFSCPGGPPLPHVRASSLGPAPRVQGAGPRLQMLRLLGRRCRSLTELVWIAVRRARPTAPSGPLIASLGRRVQSRQQRCG
ncbi:hypothetical protein NDU88_006127 [Pleurodeles waltl]|uniref:Uncharacterized protein n=1 Tax=Pleurodeles waltl TaxID=8319 RepID=A0AAV7VLZ5_PLEWA|nr:hypothetical protein NDU88_006127 [Pleurodeles waltl]